MKVVILGTDTVRAARPADWVQLSHACRKLGFDFVVPVTWGEELTATFLGERMADAGTTTVVGHACPAVGHQLKATSVLAPIVETVAPPVACARYVRSFVQKPVHITYAGGCAGAGHEEVDVHWTPDALFTRLIEAEIDPLAQPRHVENELPVERARYASLPGGTPDPRWLSARVGVRVVEAAPLTVDAIANAGESVLLDLASSCRCACARDRFLTALVEPARATEPVVHAGVSVTADHVPVDPPPPPEAKPHESEPRATFTAHGLSAGDADPIPTLDPSLTMSREPW